MTWQRARQPNQKAERLTAILTAAGRLFDQRELNDISMRDIAGEADLSKASLYSYFSTKEEVFATLFLQESAAWYDAVEPKLKRLRSPNAQRVAKVLTDVLREHRRFCRLTVVLASVLERNLSPEFIRDFKTELNENLAKIIATLQIALPHMSVKSGTEFLYQHQAMIAGLWPLAHPSPSVMEVLQGEEFQGLQIDFYQLFHQSIEELLP